MHRFEIESRPWVRWWWLQGPFCEDDILGQLVWLRDNGFGGVELAWLCPLWQIDKPASARLPKWLGPEFSELLEITKRCCDQLELGCDFTFGSAWPFGGTCVAPEDASRTFDGLADNRLTGSWEEPDCGYALDHLSSLALRNYAKSLMPAFAGVLEGSTSALFCDSWEINKRRLWSDGLWDVFESRYGYDLRTFIGSSVIEDQVRYDYRKLVGETVVREFYECFTEVCHEVGARSRVQCHGSPTDLISAYAAVDIPETEAILYNPQFSRIPSSSAALAEKPVVSCETFTCLYGFPTPLNLLPRALWRKERVADLKLLADGLFAQGVNQIIWHGMPYNPVAEPGSIEFYAAVHVGPDCAFQDELSAFNGYLQRICETLKRGRTLSRVAVYLPNEDEILRGELPPDLRVPGSQDYSEMRYVTIPGETEDYAPLWISSAFLNRAHVRDGKLCYGSQIFEALYIDVHWLDYEALAAITQLAEAGLPVVLKRLPEQPGYRPRSGYQSLLSELSRLAFRQLAETPARPLLRGNELPWFWARLEDSVVWVFLAHPAARELKYPMTYGQSRKATRKKLEVQVDAGGWKRVRLDFEPHESLLMRIEGEDIQFVDLGYSPPEPMVG